MQFPNLDPIPIPAPVWLMKVLSLLTLALHFFAVQLLIGSLVAVIYFSLRAKGAPNQAERNATLTVARRLPIVMTYVINLGIPPLLFAQVLYGRALYTSSILVAAQWIAVVFLLIPCYWLLYRISDRSLTGKPVHWHAIGSLLLAALVGHIYATNMTLMLRPEVWQAMYAKSATGLMSPPHDPTTEPRLLFVLVGGFLVAGFWLLLHTRTKSVDPSAVSLLNRTGTAFALIGAVGELAAGYWAYRVQPTTVLAGMHSPYQIGSQALWGGGFVLAFLVAIISATRRTSGVVLPVIGSLTAFLGIAGAVMVRDEIRDVTLLQKGFDVWNRHEASNWYVIGLFLLLFVLGLVTIGWLLSVMKSAKPIAEQVIS